MAERDLSSKRVFSLRATIRDFVETLPEPVRAKLDAARMTPFPTEHVSGGATVPRQRFADTVWTVAGRDGHPGLAIAFEFQSTVDRNMAHRALDLQMRVRDALTRSRKGGDAPVPPVLPVVVSAAGERWRAPRTVAEVHAPFAFGDPEIDACCAGNGYMLVEAMDADSDRVPERPGPYHLYLLLEHFISCWNTAAMRPMFHGAWSGWRICTAGSTGRRAGMSLRRWSVFWLRSWGARGSVV